MQCPQPFGVIVHYNANRSRQTLARPPTCDSCNNKPVCVDVANTTCEQQDQVCLLGTSWANDQVRCRSLLAWSWIIVQFYWSFFFISITVRNNKKHIPLRSSFLKNNIFVKDWKKLLISNWNKRNFDSLWNCFFFPSKIFAS